MIDKILLKDYNNAVIYFTNRSPVTVTSDCGSALELLAILVGPWKTPEEKQEAEMGELITMVRKQRENDDDKTDIIELEEAI